MKSIYLGKLNKPKEGLRTLNRKMCCSRIFFIVELCCMSATLTKTIETKKEIPRTCIAIIFPTHILTAGKFD